MPELAVFAQVLWDRAGPAPTLTVTDDPQRWCAVELAAAPEKLVAPLAPGGVASWASWQRGMVRPGPITVPQDAWSALRSAERLYYRAHSSASENAWVDHRFTVPDRAIASVPSIRLCDVWTSGDKQLLDEPVPHIFEAADRHPELPAILAQETIAALICLHRFSPKRPVDPSQLELAVLVAGANPVRILVQRLAYRSLSSIADHVKTIAGSLKIAGREPDESALLRLLGPEALRWPRERRGPFLILRNNSPAPEEEGGTCVVMSDTGQCVYWAKTKWHGHPEVVMPS